MVDFRLIEVPQERFGEFHVLRILEGHPRNAAAFAHFVRPTGTGWRRDHLRFLEKLRIVLLHPAEYAPRIHDEDRLSRLIEVVVAGIVPARCPWRDGLILQIHVRDELDGFQRLGRVDRHSLSVGVQQFSTERPDDLPNGRIGIRALSQRHAVSVALRRALCLPGGHPQLAPGLGHLETSHIDQVPPRIHRPQLHLDRNGPLPDLPGHNGQRGALEDSAALLADLVHQVRHVDQEILRRVVLDNGPQVLHQVRRRVGFDRRSYFRPDLFGGNDAEIHIHAFLFAPVFDLLADLGVAFLGPRRYYPYDQLWFRGRLLPALGEHEEARQHDRQTYCQSFLHPFPPLFTCVLRIVSKAGSQGNGHLLNCQLRHLSMSW